MANTSDIGSNKAGATAKVHEKTLDGLKQSVAKATAGFEEAQPTIDPSLETSQRGASNALLFAHDRLGAYARSTQIWADGLQDLAQQAANLARTSIAEANEHLKKLAAAGFETEAVEMQTRIMRASAEKAVAEASRLANAYIGLTEKAFAATVSMSAEPAR
jgi:phasin family protein